MGSSSANSLCLEGRLWAVENFSENRVVDFLNLGPGPLANWINDLLLYDKTVIPLQDFLVPTVMATQFGMSRLVELLEADELSFVRLSGGVAYLSPGVAAPIGAFASFVHPAHTRGHDHAAGQAKPPPTDVVIDRALGALRTATGMAPEPRLRRLLLDRTTDVHAEEFIVEIGDRILLELKDDQLMREWAGADMRDGQLVLPGPPNAATVYPGALPQVEGPGARLASLLGANTELWLSAVIGRADLATTGPIETVLARRAMRHLCSQTATTSFSHLREILNVPDVGLKAFGDPGTFQRLLTLRRSKAGTDFRNWFHKQARYDDPVAVARATVEILEQGNFVGSFPMKILRFLATTALGSALPGITSLVAGALDAFVVERLFGDRGAKFFLDELRTF